MRAHFGYKSSCVGFHIPWLYFQGPQNKLTLLSNIINYVKLQWNSQLSSSKWFWCARCHIQDLCSPPQALKNTWCWICWSCKGQIIMKSCNGWYFFRQMWCLWCIDSPQYSSMGHPQSSKFSWISVVLFCSRSLLSDALHHIGKRISRKIVEDFSTRSANLFDPWVPFYQFHSPLEIVRLESIINYNLWLHLLTLPLCPPCHFIEV